MKATLVSLAGCLLLVMGAQAAAQTFVQPGTPYQEASRPGYGTSQEYLQARQLQLPGSGYGGMRTPGTYPGSYTSSDPLLLQLPRNPGIPRYYTTPQTSYSGVSSSQFESSPYATSPEVYRQRSNLGQEDMRLGATTRRLDNRLRNRDVSEFAPSAPGSRLAVELPRGAEGYVGGVAEPVGPLDLDQLSGQGDWPQAVPGLTDRLRLRPSYDYSRLVGNLGPSDLRGPTSGQGLMFESPLDRLLGRTSEKRAAETEAGRGGPGGEQGEPGAASDYPAGRVGVGQQGAADAGGQPRGSQLARSLRPAGEQQAGGPEGPVIAPQPGQVGTARPGSQGPQVPLRTFVGTEKSRFNDYMAEAESALKEGRYFQAADRYMNASVIDLDHPLPLLGRAMALLAAGDFQQASGSLFRAIELSSGREPIAVDLASFVPDLKVMDRRRADLEKMLEAMNDFRLSFLLGFAEYSSGLEKLGLEHMSAAAARAPDSQSYLSDFVERLRKRHQEPDDKDSASPENPQ